ncbi:IS1 family transposase [Pectobacterium brasiliense]|uniref:IS1 family transposase n=1 Tax=Pectobacterium brasiliense TaxID=180957 RepID=A0AAE2WDW3_9GAMM|nr:IS1 family transposase [Pectobacterium brasiliense]MBA0217002.1 IS1 family transposase [Pectobacterium brasiliense]MBN3051614.1 IS1 family transposase [Pectobacterium brasiliense]MBN3073396.1 IS1 family transposase [Pectobacterium brasiliense]MBN3169072.1 IS1 family transposase [Pectobacterium brasiliense]
MTVTIDVSCRYCYQTELVRQHGTEKAGFPRYCCQHCRRTFQINYCYNADKPGTKEKIVDMAMNGSK